MASHFGSAQRSAALSARTATIRACPAAPRVCRSAASPIACSASSSRTPWSCRCAPGSAASTACHADWHAIRGNSSPAARQKHMARMGSYRVPARRRTRSPGLAPAQPLEQLGIDRDLRDGRGGRETGGSEAVPSLSDLPQRVDHLLAQSEPAGEILGDLTIRDRASTPPGNWQTYRSSTRTYDIVTVGGFPEHIRYPGVIPHRYAI